MTESVLLDAPVLAEATRGMLVESAHRGAVAVTDAHGRVVFGVGDIDQPVYPRSAIKPLQALPLIETGAAEAFGVTDAELALACASHGGTLRHTQCVSDWLARVELGEGDLGCGVQSPAHRESARSLVEAGVQPTALHNNCSGKHAGMLTTAVHCGDPLAGYLKPDHPVQQRVLCAVEDMVGADLSGATAAVDGCGIPVVAMPLRAMALGMARLAKPMSLPDARAAACDRIRAAMAAEPELVAFPGSLVTDVIGATGGRVLVKNGAEGVFSAALPVLGLGVALKIADGAGRAAQVAVMATLARLGALTEAETTTLAERITVPLRNWAGTLVGVLRPASALQ